MLYKEDWEKSKERFKALWQNEIIDRCCISVIAPKDGSIFREERIPEKYEDRKRYWTEPELIYKRNINKMENTYFGGDAIPMIWLNLGPNGHAAYFGSECKFEKNTVWFSPVINDWEKDILQYDPQNKYLLQTKEIAKYLCEQGKDKFLVSMPDNGSALDALAHLRGTENLLMDFILYPEKVKDALDKIIKVWLDTNDMFFNINKDCNNNGSCIGWLNTWAPGRHSQLECDLSVMISTELFREFVMKELTLACESIEYSLYHLDGIEQIRHLELLLSIDKLNMIQWTSVVGQPPPTEFIPVLKKIQQAGKCLLLNVKPEYVETLLTELSSEGLYIVTEAQNENDARALERLARKLTKD